MEGKKSFAISGVIRLDYNYPPAPGTLGAGGGVHLFLISGDYPYGTGVSQWNELEIAMVHGFV